MVLLAGCPREAPPPTPAPAASDLDACLDRELARAGLNRFGDPADTAYAGGTPLFDEATGRQVPRLDYVRARRADLARTCAPP